MMQTRISKTLEAIIARVTFDVSKSNTKSSYKDRLALEILREEGALAYQMLSTKLKDWELYQLPQRIEREIETSPEAELSSPEEFYTSLCEQMKASTHARSVSTAHALRFIASDAATATSRILAEFDISDEMLDEEIARIGSSSDDNSVRIDMHVIDLNREETRHTPNASLDKFGVNLTRLAREGRIDPVIGRTDEIDRVIQILSRRKKNNPMLIGEAGVGKSAIVEGLALRMASGDVPYTIAGKELYSLDVSSLVAGTKFRGEFEERMQQLIESLSKSH